ncbi:hypothetical protein [Ruegeria halocynthiae]|uniref:hypothetical protein n=1 Tax=Ruegeria halocynthiae TaxID=985054 RepID=UPI00055E70BA|nr:hypothetical protein [Ruegeria halocynthiae]
MKKVHPKINIERLREIGWSLWDPIGLNYTMGGWKGQPFEDEYDTYLVKAVEILRNQLDANEVGDYLFFIETEHMGLAPAVGGVETRAKLLALVQVISAEPLVWKGH